MRLRVNTSDRDDKRQARTTAVLLSLILIALIGGIIVLAPELFATLAPAFNEGVGLRSSAIISFFLTLVVMLVFTLAAGDGLIGEIQFVLPAFFVFFLFFWLGIAWLF